MIEKNKCLVQFKYKCKDVFYEKVGIVGCLDILKNWDINNPVFLTKNEENKIFILEQIELPKDQKIEYKYVFYHKNEKIWEDLPNNVNRQLEIKENSPLIILDKEGDPNSTKEYNPIYLRSLLKKKPRKTSGNTEGEPKEDKDEPKKKKIKKKKKKKAKDKNKEEEKDDKEEEKEKIKKQLNNIDEEMNEKLKNLDYDSDEKEEINKDKDQKQKEPQKYSDIKEDDDIIMCSFYLPFEPIKENDTFKLKLNNSPLYHILYKVIEKEKNIKWFGSLKDEKIYSEEEREKISEILEEKNMYLLNINSEVFEKTKILFSGIFEPLFHYITLDENSMDTYVNFSEYWKEYRKYIDSVCNTILPHISKKKKTLIFLHDIYFTLFPTIFINKCNSSKEYQDILSNISMGLYIHISFPSHEIFKRIPAREEIITSLIKCQVLGFHTFDHSRNFLKTSKRLLGANFVSTIHGDLAANYMENTALIRVKNVTPEIDLIKEYQKDPKFQEKYNEITNKYKGKLIFLAMDHLFFPITIKNKLVAYKRFLSSNIERAKKVVFLLIIRSSANEEKYAQNLETINKITKEIKEEFGNEVIDVELMDLTYVERLALLASANCYVRTTKQESYSMSVYEFLILKKLYNKEADSACIISELSGVNTSLANTIKVNPFDYNSLMKGFSDAFQQLGNKEYSDKDYLHAEKSSLKNWFYSFLKDIKNIKLSDENTYYLGVDDTFNFKLKKISSKFNQLSPDVITHIYGQSFKRLIFLDFEGTLPTEDIGQGKVEKLFKDRKPSEDILNLLTELTNDKKNSVFIVAGKGSSQLNDWFGSIPNLGLSAEHGYLYKANSKDNWRRIVDKYDTNWRKNCINIMEPYTQRCEGSSLEIKESSVVWQYSECDQELGKAFASVITSELQVALKNREVKILNGKGFVEVISLGINKGYFISYIIKEKIKQKKAPDFILCIGDDAGDEKMFNYLNKKKDEILKFNHNANLISITVGKKPSEAEYYVNSPKDVRDLINKLTLKLPKSVSSYDIKKAAMVAQFQDEQEHEEKKNKKI